MYVRACVRACVGVGVREREINQLRLNSKGHAQKELDMVMERRANYSIVVLL